jgi:hypothetical protein
MQALQEAGWPAYVTIALALAATGLALGALGAAAAKAKRPAIALSIAAVTVSVATAGMGGLGYFLQMRQAFEAVAYADPSSRAAMLAQGISEAMNNVVIGGVCAAPAFFLGIGALILAALRSPARAPG